MSERVEASGSPPGEETTRPEPRGRRRRRWFRRIVRGLAALLLVAAVAVIVVAQTGPGQRLALETALNRLRSGLRGELTVASVRGPGLLRGVVLAGIRLTSGEGRTFLRIDSLEARYSVVSLLAGRPRLHRVTAWGPTVEVSRYPGEEESNVSRLTVERAPSPDSAGAPTEVALGALEIVNGTVAVLSPTTGEEGPRTPTVQVNGDDITLRRLALERISGEMEDVLLTLGGSRIVDGFLTSLSLEAAILDRPLVVAEAVGRLTYGVEGFYLREAFLRTPASALVGELAFAPQPARGGALAFTADLDTEGPASLADLAWLDDRLPRGTFEGGLTVSAGAVLEVGLRDMAVELEASRLGLDGGLSFDEGVRLEGLVVEASPLAVARLAPWVPWELPVEGWLSGRTELSGSASALSVDGRVTLVPQGVGARPTTADLRGTLHLGDDPGATGLTVRLDPLSYGLIERIRPAVSVRGEGSATVELSGRVRDGMRLSASLVHASDSLSTSRAMVRGSLRRPAGEVWSLDIQGDLSPVRPGLLAPTWPGLELGGSVSGSVRVAGRLDSLHVTGELEGGGGTLGVDAGLDLLDLARRYHLDLDAERVVLSDVFGILPSPSAWSGRVTVEGSGFHPDSADVVASLEGRGSRVGGLHVDTLTAAARIAGGVLAVDTLSADLAGLKLSGAGRLGLSRDAEGEATVAFAADSIIGLRSIFLGDTVVARDTLTALEWDLLALEGIDPDTLATAADVAVEGAVEGRARLSGSLSSLDVEGSLSLRQAAFGTHSVDDLEVEVVARGLPSMAGNFDVRARARGVDVYERTFADVDVSTSVSGREGRGEVTAVRAPGEEYRVLGDFVLDSVGGGVVDLEEASAAFDSVSWSLVRPTSVAWDSATVRVEDAEISRAGDDPMSIRADGTVSRRGASDFRLSVTGVHLERLMRLAQLEDAEVEGHLDTELTVRGPAAAPHIVGSFSIREPRFESLALTALAGSVRYRDRLAAVSFEARDGDATVLTVDGDVPLDLSLSPGTERVVEEPMDVRVRADSLAAEIALSYISSLEDVEGTVAADLQVGGTLESLEPRGELTLSRGAWTLEALGVRHRDIRGSLDLSPDRTVRVSLQGRAAGSVEVSGAVEVDSLTNPALDLEMRFTGFQAVQRADVTGRISGTTTLTGRYRQPLVEGSLRVDQGTLFLEEFARNAEVVDLSDPRIFEVVDTTAFTTPRLLEGIRNPFMDRLRVDVDLSVPRDTWLRSQDMNVEMGGDLIVTYDRTDRDLVLVGELQALRGSYTVLGRRFEVQEGTVGFIGTPGINPTLAIRAVSSIRRRQAGTPLQVTAAVSGTLTEPRVGLSTDDEGIPESDLVSYLIFGRPSHELASGQEAIAEGAGDFLGTYLTGSLASQLGTAVAQRVGLDYLSITQAGDLQLTGGQTGSVLADTKIEVGQYLSEDVFVVVVLRTSSRPGSSSGYFGGGRVEWALSDNYTVEAFMEDRFLRSRTGSFGDLGVQTSQVLGVFIFREWGY